MNLPDADNASVPNPPSVEAQLLIDGRVVTSAGERRTTCSPATGRPLGSFVLGTSADVDNAVASARAAQAAWAALSVFDRIAYLGDVVRSIRERRTELGLLLSLEQGKVYSTEALSEIDEAVDNFETAMRLAPSLDGSMPPSMDRNKRILLYRVPRGVAASIQPWNWPVALIAANAAPALVTGNTVVSVPAPSTSLVAYEFCRAIVESGLPAGVFNFVSGEGSVVGDALTKHDDVDVVAFTGSTATGQKVAQNAAGKPTLLELGGNGPTVVLDDADLNRVIPAILFSSFYVAGQACTATGVVLVQDGIHDRFVDALKSAVQNEVHLGIPTDEASTIGPLNNPGVVAKVQAHIDGAIDAGARLILGGSVDANYPTANYMQPTLLTEVTGDMAVAQEETFGPVIAVQRIATPDEALEIMRESPYGLASAIFTADLDRALRFAEAAPTGQININEHSIWTEGHLPFGGGTGKHSGTGRSQGRYVMEDVFSELKTVIIHLT